MTRIVPVTAAALLAAAPLAAQDTTQAAPADSQPVFPGQQPPATPLNLWRASWYGDRQPVRVGELVTIVIDEQTRASESTAKVAEERRRLGLGFAANLGSAIGPYSLDATADATSRDVGNASRKGDLTGAITARVVGMDRLGILEVEGTKAVTIDGRPQNLTVRGFVRPEDIVNGNVVPSSRVADAEILYKGKKIGARKGIIGNILSLLWP